MNYKSHSHNGNKKGSRYIQDNEKERLKMEVEHAKAKNGFYLLTKSAINALTCLYSRLLVWYNRHTTEGLEVCRIDNQGIQIPDTSRLGFLYKKISMPRVPMSYWLQTPEFVDEMNRMVIGNEDINDQVVRAVMVSVYEKILPYKGTRAGQRYNYYKLRQGIRRLDEAIQSQR